MSERPGYEQSRRSGASLGIPGWVHHLAQRDDTPHADDDEFNGTSLDSAWTHLQTTGSPTVTVKRGVLSVVTGVQTANDCNAFLKPIASGSNVVIETFVRGLGTSANYLMVGCVFSTGTATSSNVIWQMTYGGGTHYILDQRSGTFTNVATDHNAPGSSAFIYYFNAGIYFRYEYDSTNGFKQFWSIDGVSFHDFGGAYVSNPLGGAPTHMGIGYSTWGGTSRLVSFDYFRVNPS